MDETTSQASEPENRGGMNPVMIVVILVILAAGGWWLYSKYAKNGQENSMEPAEMESATPTSAMAAPTTELVATPTVDKDGVVNVELEGGSFYYKPNVIKVKKGDKVKVTLKSVDMIHDFVITELNVKSPRVKSGDTGTVEFTADQIGTFEFFCSVGQHRAMGMVGKLIVE
jgi:plastocyanin